MAIVEQVPARLARSRPAPEPRAWRSDAIPPARRLNLATIAGIVVFGASLLALDLGGRALTYHEVLFAQPAREMTEGAGWLLPQIAGQPYLDKPPATAWALAASMTLFGAANEWTARVPSVAAELVIALAVAAVAARWFDRRTAWIAACLQITSVYTVMQARLAESDMLLAAAVTIAWACMAVAVVAPQRGVVGSTAPRSKDPASPAARPLAVVFYAAAGAAFLIKGPLGPAFILGGAACYALVDRQGAVWRWLRSPIGWAVFIACLALWPLAAYDRYPAVLEIWRAHHWGRFRGELGGRQPPSFYLYTSLWLLLPWTPAVLWAVYRAVERGLWRAPIWKFTAAWIVPGLILLSLARFQHKHYIIPLLPPLAIVAAVGLLDWVGARNRNPWPRPAWSAALTAAGGTVAIAAVIQAAPPATASIVVVIGWAVLGMLWFNYCESRQEPRLELASMMTLAWTGIALALLTVLPAFDSYVASRDFGRAVTRLARPDRPIYLVALPDHPSTFYIDAPLARYDDPGAFAAAIPRLQQVSQVVAPARLRDELAQMGDVRRLAAQSSLPRYQKESDRPTLFQITRR